MASLVPVLLASSSKLIDFGTVFVFVVTFDILGCGDGFFRFICFDVFLKKQVP